MFRLCIFKDCQLVLTQAQTPRKENVHYFSDSIMIELSALFPSDSHLFQFLFNSSVKFVPMYTLFWGVKFGWKDLICAKCLTFCKSAIHNSHGFYQFCRYWSWFIQAGLSLRNPNMCIIWQKVFPSNQCEKKYILPNDPKAHRSWNTRNDPCRTTSWHCVEYAITLF